MLDEDARPRAICRCESKNRVLTLPIWANARRQEQRARGIKSEAAWKGHDPGWQHMFARAFQIGRQRQDRR